MISNELDPARYRGQLAREGRVQIPGFLQAEAAETLRQCLLEQVPWSLAERGRPDRPLVELDADEERVLLKEAYARARDNRFHFVYDRYLILEAARQGRAPAFVLQVVLEFFNSPQFLEFIQYLTGDAELAMVGAQATRYRPGEFLREHDDHHRDEARRFAYVVNLSKSWEADWGGLLHFTDAAGAVTRTFLPWFNSLSLFKVPALHHVGVVAPWAQEPRLAITGWWHARPAT